MSSARSNLGFTLIEMLLVIGIISILFTISSLLLLNLIPRASLTTQVQVLVAELRNQQLKAMVGETSGSGSQQAYSLRVASDEYTLFGGDTYDPMATNNLNFEVEQPFQLQTTMPSQLLIFESGSGELRNYSPGQNTLTFTNTNTSESITVELNRYGVVTGIY